MATDRNDQLLAEILGEFRGFGVVLGEIRDRLPNPASAASAEPVTPEAATDVGPVDVDIREPQTPRPRKTATKRTPAKGT